MEAEAITLALYDLIDTISEFDDEEREQAGFPESTNVLDMARVLTFGELGIVTPSTGLVLGLPDGSEFQVVLTRRGRDSAPFPA